VSTSPKELQPNHDSVEALRAAGFAVVIFNPEELSGALPDRVCDRLIETGWDVINILKNQR